MPAVFELRSLRSRILVQVVLTLLVMPLAFSISEGIAIGFVVYAVLMLASGRGRQVTALAYVLAILFLAHFVFRPA